MRNEIEFNNNQDLQEVNDYEDDEVKVKYSPSPE